MSRFPRTRYALFRLLCNLGWFVCPEPHRTILMKAQLNAYDWAELDDLMAHHGLPTTTNKRN